MKRIAVTGATGAVGTALLERCVSYGAEAYVFVRPGSARVNHIPESPLIHKVFCGLDDMRAFDVSGLPECDVFYHFAWGATHGASARNDMDIQIRNIRYTIDAVRMAARLGCRKFIGAGSQAEYGRVEGILCPDTPCFPENGYGMAKLCAGEMSRVECAKYGISHVWARILSVYGPGDGAHTMVSGAIRKCLAGETPSFTKGEQLWDYLYNKDAGEAFYRIGDSGRDGAVYVLGSGRVRTLREYIEVICHTANPAVTPVFGVVPYMDRQVMHLQADLTTLTRDTGFVPETEFEDGIRETVSWVRSEMEEG